MKTMLLAAGIAMLSLTACGGSTDGGGASKAGSGGNSGTGGASGGNSGTGGASGGNSGTGGATGGSGGVDAGACNTACSTPADCTLAPVNCCICGSATLSDYTPVNTQSLSTCGCGGPTCQCASMPNPNLAATCANGACTAFDVSSVDAYSSCQGDADCRLRIGLSCCEKCSSNGYDVVAVNVNEAALGGALCGNGGNGTVGCPGCIPSYPADKKAVCVSGHCQVQ